MPNYMEHIINRIANTYRMLLMACMLFVCSSAVAQITSVHGTVSDDMGPLIGATVCEVDGNNRIIESAITDLNGNFTMRVKNPKDKLRISYIGYKTLFLKFDRSTYEVKMEEEGQLAEVVVTTTRRMSGNGLAIPEREVSYAYQGLSTKDFEGLGLNTVDEALQGRIAGLDIVGNSGNLGSGSTMRLRGSGSLSSLTDANPLIVVDGNVREVDLSSFDVASASDEKFAELLNINADDIAEIRVLKDASATAVYGSQGGNGVIELTTKRGTKGKPRITYTAKMTATYQPKGMKLLNGDDYTMLLKEAYFNPEQNDAASNIPEISYLPLSSFSEANQYNDNTDWRDAVTQWGLRQNHYVSLRGGGDKAQFSISAGYDHETGTVIAQKLQRFSTRVNLDYNISQRIRVSTNFSLIRTQNNQNSDNLLAIAQKKMPNMSIYEEDIYGNDIPGHYYNMIQSGPHIGSEIFKDDQRGYVNPVASAYLAKNVSTKFDITPELIINYELLGMDNDHHRLTWNGRVYTNVFNNYNDKFYPAELVSTTWASGHNRSDIYSSKSVSYTTKHSLTFTPHFNSKDHSAMFLGRFEMTSGSSSWQSTAGSGLPSGGIESPTAGGLVTGLGSSYSQWRSMYFTFLAHYAYKDGRYSADVSARADGITKFGPDKRWGYFPAVSLRWNIIDEPFMKAARSWLSMLSIRPSWGVVGSAPNQNYLYTSKYGAASMYLDMSAMVPLNLRLTNLQWEWVNQYNLGFDVGVLKDRLKVVFEVFNSTRTNMLMSNYRIPSNSGYSSTAYYNTGKLRNTGWEFHINSNRLVKIGKDFTADFNVNFSNNRSELLDMDPTVLENMNSTFTNDNRQVLTRVQLHNPLNAIYGFRSKGVYMYQYETIKNMPAEQQQAFIDAGNTAPIALNAEGKIIRDDKGDPIQMMFNYNNEGTGRNYKFKGGDAIYEDINNDGQINALDIVYLGSSLPKLTGGFGFNMSYKAWRLATQFTYRIGVDIINIARLDAEAMSTNNNQSQAVNYRWRKEGDVTSIPRAMYGAKTNYNTLISDRFVEDGSYLRMSYVQLSYSLNSKQLKALGLNRISFHLSANNPLILTKYTGVDPDISASRYSPAQDYGQTPRARSYTLSLGIEF